MTSFASAGIGLDERELQLLLERGQPLLELGDELAQVAVAAGGVEVVAAPRATPARACTAASSSFSRRPASAASRWSL